MFDKKPLRVLQIVGDSKFGGASVVICDIMSTLRDHGIDATILTTNLPTIKFMAEKGFKTWPFKGIQRAINPFKDLCTVIRLAWQIRGKYDVIHTHTTKGGAIGRFAAWLANIPIVIHTVHGFAFHEFSSSIAIRLGSIAERILAMLTDRIIFVNDYDRVRAIEMKILPSQKAVTVYNGIAEERLLIGRNISREKLLKKLSLNHDVFLSVFVGRLVKQKGLGYLFDAIKIVHDAMPECNIHQVIVGEGELSEQYRQQVKLAGIADRVHFLGFQQDAVQWTGGADVFVLSSLWEGHSITLLEAMGCARPIVATDIKGNRESITHEYDGLLVKAGDAHSLAAAIMRIASDRKLSQSLGKHARETFNNRFTIQKMTENIWAVYTNLLQEKHLI